MPDINSIGSDNFNKAEDIIRIGEKAARAAKRELEQLAEMLNGYDDPQVNTLPKNDSLLFIQISYLGNSNVNTYLLEDLSLLVPEKYYTPENVNKAIERMYGTGFFDKITYKIFPLENGFYHLVFYFQEKAKGAIKFALKYDSYFGPAAMANLVLKSTILKNDKLFIPIEVGPSPYAKILYHKTMNNFNNLAVYGYGQLEANEVPFYSVSDTVSVRMGRQFQTYLKASVGTNIGPNTRNLFGAEWQWNYCKQSYKDGLDQQLSIKYSQFENYRIELYYLHNSLDRHYFASRGVESSIKLGTTLRPASNVFYTRDSVIKYTEAENYYQAVVDYSFVFPFGKSLRIKPGFSAAYTWGKAQNMDNYFLGGDSHNSRSNTFPFYGYANYRLIAQSFYLANFEITHLLGRNNYVLAGANYARFFNRLDRDILDFRKGSHYGLMLGYGLLTKVGPLWIKWAQIPAEDGYLHINLGFRI
jgi:NTE family protein